MYNCKITVNFKKLITKGTVPDVCWADHTQCKNVMNIAYHCTVVFKILIVYLDYSASLLTLLRLSFLQLL